MPVKYNITSPRDVKQQSQDRFDYKLDRRQPIRAVICDELGNDSGSGDIWYDRSKRRVWIRELGTSSASIVFCYNLTPVIGLGVLVGWRPYSNIKEVLSSDIEFLGQTNTTGTSYESPSNLDFLPGGRLQLWLQSKLIQPLATYPSTSGLVVNVASGYYIYNGVRTTFAGQVNIDLSASQPTAGNYVFVGLYLDSANTLQTIAGASGATTPPAEPAWPDGAFRLSVVRLYNPQTKVNLKLDTDADNDIFDRRIIWTDVDSFDIWPYDKIITVSQTNAFAKYSTIQDANDNTTGPAIVLPDGGTYTETLTLNSGAIGYSSLGSRGEVTITSTSATTVDITGAGIALRNLTVSNSNAGATATTIQTVEDNTILNNIRILKTASSATTSIGLHVTGGGDSGTTLTNGVISVTAGTTKYGILMDTDTCYLLVDGGQIQGDTYDIRLNNANAFLTLQNDVKFLGGGIQVAAGHIISDEPIVTTITGPYTADTAINGKSPAESIIATAQNTTDVTLTPNASDLQFANWTIRNTGAGGGGISHTALTNAQTGLVLDGCVIERKTGSCTTSIAFSSSAGDTLARNCEFNSANGLTVNYSVYLSGASTVVIEGGEITAGTIVTAHASAVLELRGVRLGSGVTFDKSGGGTIRGWYVDSSGIVRLVGVYQLFKPNYPTNDIWRCNAASKSDFVATIATLPGGAVLTYNAPSSGDENNLVPNSTSQIAKMVLHNTTRGTNALISNNVAGTNTITLTANVPAGWTVGDTITIRSQTNTSNPATNVYYVDFEFTSDVDSLAKSFIPSCALRDTGAAASLVAAIFHPFEANSTSKSRPARLTGTNVTMDFTMPMIPLTSSRFCLGWDATGTGTLLIIIRLSGEGAAYQ